MDDFREQEHLLGSQLAGLAVDASWLKSYAVATLVATKEAMQVGLVVGCLVGWLQVAGCWVMFVVGCELVGLKRTLYSHLQS